MSITNTLLRKLPHNENNVRYIDSEWKWIVDINPTVKEKLKKTPTRLNWRGKHNTHGNRINW